jgi:hypothetical protein
METQGYENKTLESKQAPAAAKKESSHAMDPEFEPA